MRTCQQCGKELPNAAHRNKRFCTECYAQRQSIRSKRRYEKIKADPVAYAKRLEANREYEEFRKAKRKLLRQAAPSKTKPIRIHHCVNCGRRFKPNYKGEKYCSHKCYSQSPLRRLFLEHVNQKFGMDLDFNFFYD